jgi:hypothetical protein
MEKGNKNKGDKPISDIEIERQKIIDEGGTQEYGDKSKNKNKDDNVLIDSEH